jgi:UDP-GlcNAc:undecaprenyl-phosphate GlcNAc-1-phosphate transferase
MIGNIAYTILSFSFVGTLTAFFYFNVFGKKNKIFLGDTGSMITGFVIGSARMPLFAAGISQ